MTKRNIAWLVAIVAVGVGVTLVAGVVWGLIAAGVVLVVSELVERAVRRKRRAARGASGAPSLGDAINSRRKQR